MSNSSSPLRVASVIPSLNAGGMGPVCRYAAAGVAELTDWQVTLLSLHDPVGEFTDEVSGLRVVCLGLEASCARLFLQWLIANPQDVVITSDVTRIESAFQFLPHGTHHIVQIHDSGRRYRDVAVRHSASVDGVICVGKHIEAPLRQSLEHVGFRGLLRTVHNGASFPPLKERPPYHGPLRLLFVGRVDALKGVFDFVPLLQRLKKIGVPIILNLVGGENELLCRRFQQKGLSDMVRWTGIVPHKRCYDIAAESDLLLVPSRKESFGMVTVEAMSMGCVPMAYDIVSGSREIIEHGKSGLLVPLGDFRAWATEIHALHADRDQLGHLSAGAIERARTQFNSNLMAGNIVQFIEQVACHSETHPTRRDAGMPPPASAEIELQARGYQRLPLSLRNWIRNTVTANPRLCYWLLNR